MNWDRGSHFSISLPQGEREFILEAIQKSGAASASVFLRDAALDKAQELLGRSYEPPGALQTAPRNARLDIAASIDAGAAAGAKQADLVFPSLRRFATTFSDQNRAVLRWIGESRPDSIHDLARRFNYPYANLSRNLRTLEAIGVVGYEQPDGQTLRPVLMCRQMKLRLALDKRGGDEGRIFRICVPALGSTAAIKDADLVLGSMEELTKTVPDRGYALLRLMAEHDPANISALAQLTGKSVANTYTLLRHLTAVGLTRTVPHGAAKKPELLFDGITVNLRLA
jgi:predicted transcriptional regulator